MRGYHTSDGTNASLSSSVESFYENLQNTIVYHHTSSHSANEEITNNLTDVDAGMGAENNDGTENITFTNVNVQFSGEEVFGKYLDLSSLHLELVNVLKVKSSLNIDMDYLQYLDRFSMFFYIPDSVKLNSKPYYNYLQGLWNYLSDFFVRTQPLIELEEEIIKEWENEFKQKVETGQVKLVFNSCKYGTLYRYFIYNF